MSVSITVTFTCGGCPTTATAPAQVIRREFVSFSGRAYGIGHYVVGPERTATVIKQATPEGWAAFDPYTQQTYCPECWASIESDAMADAVEPQEAGQ